MNESIFNNRWKIALIDPDERKIDKLRSVTGLTVYHFVGTLPFIDHLRTMTNPQECLILVLPDYLLRDLPSDIRGKVFGIYIYGENDRNELQTFNDVCLHLSSLTVAQCAKQSMYYHHFNENGTARMFAQETMARCKDVIDQLQDLCDDIDENILIGSEANN